MNATVDHRESFPTTTDSTLTGSWPRISFTRNERPILDSPAYFSITNEYFRELRESNSSVTDPVTGVVTTNDLDTGPEVWRKSLIQQFELC